MTPTSSLDELIESLNLLAESGWVDGEDAVLCACHDLDLLLLGQVVVIIG